MINERQNTILEMLGQNDQTTVKELALQLNVSSVTIRQDLNFLESEGLLKRVHGGAVLRDADDLSNRLGVNYEKKLNIARKLAGYCQRRGDHPHRIGFCECAAGEGTGEKEKG